MLDHLISPPPGAVLPENACVITLMAADGLALRAAFWPAPETIAPRGTLLIAQGRSEFIEKYGEVIGEALARGFAVAAFDWRGQGGSERQLANPMKGHVEDFSDYLLDLDAMIKALEAQDMPQPWHLLAHSMGGAISLMALARGPSPFMRALLLSPMVDIAPMRFESVIKPVIRLLAGIGLSGFFVPGGGAAPTASKPFAQNPLTGDAARYGMLQGWLEAAPALGIGDPTIGWAAAALEAISVFDDPDFGMENRTPILMLLAGQDRVVQSQAAESLAQRLRAASAITIPQAQHELLIERDVLRAQVWAAFDAFMMAGGDA